jgi:arginine repressor
MKFTEYKLKKVFIELLQLEEIPKVNAATISRDFQSFGSKHIRITKQS